jgi:hypothetical protein
MFEWLIEKIREMEREQGSRVKRITCHGHNLPLNVTLENGYWNSYYHGAGSWANQRRLRKEIKAAFPEVKVIRIYIITEEREEELSVQYGIISN